MTVDNAIIMAAGTSSRFAPLSYETHKALIEVKGEILIERQIKQLIDAGIKEIYVITGYKEEQFKYLTTLYDVRLIYNPEYLTRNNNGSIWAARDVLGNSYVCSADNYFTKNPFEMETEESYYAAEYSKGKTREWCMTEDEKGFIDSVTIGGSNSWYMMGHTFWSESFSQEFLRILEKEYNRPNIAEKLWESILAAHLDTLKMRIKKYEEGVVFEFDTLDELRLFDSTYKYDTRSRIIKEIAKEKGIEEGYIKKFSSIYGHDMEAIGFECDINNSHYRYLYKEFDDKSRKLIINI